MDRDIVPSDAKQRMLCGDAYLSGCPTSGGFILEHPSYGFAISIGAYDTRCLPTIQVKCDEGKSVIIHAYVMYRGERHSPAGLEKWV